MHIERCCLCFSFINNESVAMETEGGKLMTGEKQEADHDNW
jgi:hypothetical protein